MLNEENKKLAYLNVRHDKVTEKVKAIFTFNVNIEVTEQLKSFFDVGFLQLERKYHDYFICPDGLERKSVCEYTFPCSVELFDVWFAAARRTFTKSITDINGICDN